MIKTMIQDQVELSKRRSITEQNQYNFWCVGLQLGEP